MKTDYKDISWPGWETVRLIGRGSFGAVYEIQRDIFGDIEQAALKVISIPQNASDIDEMYSDGYDEESITSTFQSHLKSIVAEYSIMRKMNGCTNIVNCDDVRYVQHDDGIGWDIFIKMELLTPLTKALTAQVSEETIIKIAKDICTALELCKKHKIVHRDIKPQNIFVSPNGDYKLGDFGIAKTVEKTMGGTKIGTYKYMAPEVYNNKPYGSAADIYSLGLVLYWLLNERRMPFLPLPPAKLSAGMDEQARNRRLSGEQFSEPKNGSPELKAIVMKACAYNVEERYASASEMLADLNRIGQEQLLQTNISSTVLASNTAPVDQTKFEDGDKTVGVFGKAASDNVVIPHAQQEEGTVGLFFKSVTESVDANPADSDSTEKKTVVAAVQAEAVAKDTTTIAEQPVEPSAPVEIAEVELEFRQKENQNQTKPKPVDSFVAPKQSKKKLPIIIGAIAVVLVVAIAVLLPGMGKENTGNQSTIQNQGNQTVETQKSTQPTKVPAETATETPTEVAREIPEGTILIDGSWENGALAVVALDNSTLWIQIMDNRPDQQYEDLETPWELRFEYGEPFYTENSNGTKIHHSPYVFRLQSSAHAKLETIEYEKGTLASYWKKEYLRTLWLAKTKLLESGGNTFDPSLYVDLEIERIDNTYTAIVSFPEWFDVSAVNDLVNVHVSLYDTTYWPEMGEKGSAGVAASYGFKP